MATIKATLKKAYKMGSNDSLRFMAIRRKLVEFRLLGFTASSLKQICKRLAIETDTKIWFDLSSKKTQKIENPKSKKTRKTKNPKK